MKVETTSQEFDALTTPVSPWITDSHPSRTVLDRLLSEHRNHSAGRSLKVWLAGCSTGQEAYSIAMAAEEIRLQYPDALAEVNIVATDTSTWALDVARQGEYGAATVGNGVSPVWRKRFFRPVPRGGWAVCPEIRSRVEFRALNLLDPYPEDRFDVVVCRNVLIYFSAERKKAILARINETLTPGGFLVLGASESLDGIGGLYQTISCPPGVIYQKNLSESFKPCR